MITMDFGLSILIAGTIALTLLYSSLIIYYKRLGGIADRVTEETFQSLKAFGFSIFGLGLMFPVSIFIPSLILLCFGISLFGMIGSLLYLTVKEAERIKKFSYVNIALILVLIVESLARVLITPYPLPMIGMFVSVLPMLAIASAGVVYALRETPNPFTISMFIILIFTVIAALTHMFDFLQASPQFFMIQVLPVVIAAGVMASMLRPWRNIITLALLGLIVTVGPALFIPALLAGNMTVFLFSLSLTFALICLTIPLSFFLQQAVETRATTALYISVSLVAIGLLALTHGNNYAIANSPIGAWDESILFIDWFFGVFGVCCFTMAAIASSFSTNVRHASREIMIGIGAGLLVLGHPIVRWVQVGDELIQRWELDPLYLGIMALLLIAFIVFGRMSYQLWKAGSGRAGLRFVFFMFAALFLGIVAMFSDMIPLDLIVPLFLLSGIMLVLSSPKRNPFAKSS